MYNSAFKFRFGSDRDITTLINNQIFVPHMGELNDPFEGIVNDTLFAEFLASNSKYSGDVKRTFDGLLQKIKNGTGIYSMSADVCNELMWAHYANGHKGIAIEYDLKFFRSTFNYGHIPLMYELVVDYSDMPPILDFPADFTDKRVLNKMIGAKSKVWAYEQELRLVFEKLGLHSVPFNCIKGIYFGLRCPDSLKEQVMNGLKGRGVKYYTMETKSMRYLLEPIPEADKYSSAPYYVPKLAIYDSRLLSDSNLGSFAGHRATIKKAVEDVCIQPYVRNIDDLFIDVSEDRAELLIIASMEHDLFPIRIFKFVKGNNQNEFLIDDSSAN